MPRPKLRRRLCIRPEVTYFKPAGIPLRAISSVTLTREELEVIWLIDELDREQTAAAAHMRTSQSTIQRMLRSAHKKVAHALITGKAIALESHE